MVCASSLGRSRDQGALDVAELPELLSSPVEGGMGRQILGVVASAMLCDSIGLSRFGLTKYYR